MLFFQPYRTTPLVLPGAKAKHEVPTTSYLRHHPNPSMRASPQHYDPNLDVLMKQKVRLYFLYIFDMDLILYKAFVLATGSFINI